jgi:hypothetical protein
MACPSKRLDYLLLFRVQAPKFSFWAKISPWNPEIGVKKRSN